MTRRTDIISGIAIAVVAVLLLVAVIPAYTSPPQSEGNLSPAFLPSVAAGIMLALALLLAASAFFKDVDTDDALHEEFGSEARGVGMRESLDIALWCAFSIAMMIGFEHIGFVATASPALVLIMLYAGQRSIPAIAVVAVGIPVLLHQISWHAFSVQLP